MKRPLADDYNEHLAGIVALMVWIRRWDAYRQAITVSGPRVRLSGLPSQRLALGLPHSRAQGNPFLGVQSEELAWMSSICWDRAVIVPQESRLFLVARQFSGRACVDLPAFAVGIFFDDPDKLAIAATTGYLDARALWFDKTTTSGGQGPGEGSVQPRAVSAPDTRVNIQRGRPVFRLPVLHSTDADLFQPQELSVEQDFFAYVSKRLAQQTPSLPAA